jgi:hypothetical protein
MATGIYAAYQQAEKELAKEAAKEAAKEGSKEAAKEVTVQEIAVRMVKNAFSQVTTFEPVQIADTGFKVATEVVVELNKREMEDFEEEYKEKSAQYEALRDEEIVAKITQRDVEIETQRPFADYTTDMLTKFQVEVIDPNRGDFIHKILEAERA